jgi:hypothetical protein
MISFVLTFFSVKENLYRKKVAQTKKTPNILVKSSRYKTQSVNPLTGPPFLAKSKKLCRIPIFCRVTGNLFLT